MRQNYEKNMKITLAYVSKTLLFIPILDNFKKLSYKQMPNPKNKGYILCFYL